MSWFKKNDPPRQDEPETAAPAVAAPPSVPAPEPPKAVVPPPVAPAPISAAAPIASMAPGSLLTSPSTLNGLDHKMNDAAIVAQMGERSLNAAEVRRLLEMLSPADRERALADPATLRGFLQGELWRDVMRRRAEAAGFTAKPEAQLVAQRAADQAIAALYLADQTKPDPSFPDATLVRQYYDGNQNAFMQPQAFRLSQVYLEVPRDANDVAREEIRRKAEDLANRARSGDTFEELAKTSSMHAPSAALGGDIGWSAQQNLLPEIQPVVAAMQVGEVSAPVRSASGYHVIKLVELKPAQILPFEQVQSAIRDALIRRQTEVLREQFIQNLFRDTPATINEIALRDMLTALNPPTMAA